MSTMSMSVLPHAEFSSPAVSAGPSMRVDAPVAPGWTPWMMRLERLVFKACQNVRRQERRARRLTVTLHLVDGTAVRQALALPHAATHGHEVMPVALGLLRLLLAEHGERVARLGVSLGDLVEGADQPIRFERYYAARQRQQRVMKLASLMACFGAIGSLFTVR